MTPQERYRAAHGFGRVLPGIWLYVCNVALGLDYLASALIGRDPRTTVSFTIGSQAMLGSRLCRAIMAIYPVHFRAAVENWTGTRLWSKYDRSLWI